jgi:hypothetical protein
MLEPICFHGFNRHQLVTHGGYFQFCFVGLRFNQACAFVVRVLRGNAATKGTIL